MVDGGGGGRQWHTVRQTTPGVADDDGWKVGGVVRSVRQWSPSPSYFFFFKKNLATTTVNGQVRAFLKKTFFSNYHR